MALGGRSLAVLFADVAGSSALYERLGDAEALRAVERCLNRVERAAASYGGRLIKTIGDGAMIVFDSAETGLLGACEMQQRVGDLPPVSGVKLAVRIGVHWGPVLEEGADVFGDTVNTAARLGELAKPAQILSSRETLDEAPADTRPRWRSQDTVTVKGKRQPLSIVEVLWSDGDDLTLVQERTGGVRAPAPRLHLLQGARAFEVTTESPALNFGRDPSCEVVVQDALASRNHGRIECRSNKFVLIDRSSNGTTIIADGEAAFLVKREETLLRGSGRLLFGHRPDGQAAEWLEYRIEA